VTIGGTPVANVVDVHHHALPPVYTTELSAAGVEALPGYGFPAWSPERSLAMMDESGIELAVLSLSAPGLYFGDRTSARRLARACNEYLAGVVASEPRFGAFGCLPLPDVDAALAEAELVLDRHGLQGVVVYTNSGGIYPGDERLAPLMSYLSEREVVVFVHPLQPCGQAEAPFPVRPSILEFVFESTRAAASLVAGRTLARYPGIRWILTHGGGTLPYLAERLGHLSRDRAVPYREELDVEQDLASFFFDLASCTRPHALACLTAVAGPGRLLFGSDFPFETTASASAALAELRADPAVAGGRLNGLFRENAAALLSSRWPVLAASIRGADRADG
jgi:predicted TIM-barrel fold metal-dependent hydrolase